LRRATTRKKICTHNKTNKTNVDPFYFLFNLD
jgi:hypothetical protein